MPLTCSVCHHQHVRDIEADLLSGASVRDCEGRYGVSKSAVHRHRRACMAPRALRALARFEEQSAERLQATANGVLDDLAFQVIRCRQVMARARVDEDLGLERAFMSEHRQYLAQLVRAVETQARLVGVFGDQPVVSIDARRQVAVLGSMSEEELRRLAAGGRGLTAGELVVEAADAL